MSVPLSMSDFSDQFARHEAPIFDIIAPNATNYLTILREAPQRMYKCKHS